MKGEVKKGSYLLALPTTTSHANGFLPSQRLGHHHGICDCYALVLWKQGVDVRTDTSATVFQSDSMAGAPEALSEHLAQYLAWPLDASAPTALTHFSCVMWFKCGTQKFLGCLYELCPYKRAINPSFLGKRRKGLSFGDGAHTLPISSWFNAWHC